MGIYLFTTVNLVCNEEDTWVLTANGNPDLHELEKQFKQEHPLEKNKHHSTRELNAYTWDFMKWLQEKHNFVKPEDVQHSEI